MAGVDQVLGVLHVPDRGEQGDERLVHLIGDLGDRLPNELIEEGAIGVSVAPRHLQPIEDGIFEVKAERVHLEGYSGHADRGDLLQWLGSREGGSPRVILNHGEQSSRESLAAAMHERLGLQAELPAPLKPLAI